MTARSLAASAGTAREQGLEDGSGGVLIAGGVVGEIDLGDVEGGDGEAEDGGELLADGIDRGGIG